MAAADQVLDPVAEARNHAISVPQRKARSLMVMAKFGTLGILKTQQMRTIVPLLTTQAIGQAITAHLLALEVHLETLEDRAEAETAPVARPAALVDHPVVPSVRLEVLAAHPAGHASKFAQPK